MPKTTHKSLLAALMFASAAHSADDALAERLSAVAAQRSDRIAFTEKQYSPIFVEPAVNWGYLALDPKSGALIKNVDAPEAITMVVDDQDMLITQDGETRRISLRKRPEMQALFQSIQSLLRGDIAGLERYFTLEFVASEDQWTLTMKPLHERLERRVEVLEVRGEKARILSIRTQRAIDDYDVMTLHPAG